MELADIVLSIVDLYSILLIAGFISPSMPTI